MNLLSSFKTWLRPAGKHSRTKLKHPPRGAQRLKPQHGVINWQGTDVISYMEHDRRVGERLRAGRGGVLHE